MTSSRLGPILITLACGIGAGLAVGGVVGVGDVAHGYHVAADQAVLAQVAEGCLDQDLGLVGAAQGAEQGAIPVRLEGAADLAAVVGMDQVGEGGQRREALVAAMVRAGGFLRRELGKRLKLKHTPTLQFRWDEGLDHALRIESLLEEVRSEARAEALVGAAAVGASTQ